MKRIIVWALLCSLTVTTFAQQPVKQMIAVAEQTKKLSGIKVINIDVLFCKINFAKSDTTTIYGKLEAMEQHDDYKVIVEENGDVANVSINVPTEAKSSYAGEFTIGLASGVTVNVNNTSGNVYITEVAGCNFNIETVKGKVVIKKSDSNITATTKNGNIDGENLTGTHSYTSTNGNITLTNIEGNFKVDNSDGSVKMTNARGDFETKTINGSQYYNAMEGSLRVTGSASEVTIEKSKGVFNIKTKSGPIKLLSDEGEWHIQTEKGNIATSNTKLRLTASSDFTTTEGKINVTLLNSKEELTFDLAHEQKGDILLLAYGEKTTKKKLNTGNGPIVITGRSFTGTQQFKMSK